jgi:DNA (cytosine-5)-methyltransferase 1
MRVVSLFAGIGGFDLALTRLGHEIVYVNEWDKYAAQVYEKNFSQILDSSHKSQHKAESTASGNSLDTRTGKSKPKDRLQVDTRNIKTIPTTDIPDHELLVGGFPCQAFSVAGRRRGFEDTRGTMFFEIARILKDKRPSFLLLENVKGLLSHDNGRTFQTIMRTLDELGYNTQWQVLNSKNFGVPQNRERVFIVGNLRGQPRPEIFPISGNNAKTTKDFSYAIDANYYKGINTGSMGGRSSFIKGKRQVIYDISYPSRIRQYSGTMPTIRNYGSGGNKMPIINGIRRLTPIECERLQGFPDNWTAGVSDTQRYKQLGNAVTVNVVQYIASFIGC